MTDRELLIGNLLQLHSRMQFRVEAIEERDGKNIVTGPGVGISYLLAKDIARALAQAAEALEAAATEQAALIADKTRCTECPRREGNPCLTSLASNEPCKPDAENLRRCTICGFVVDLTYIAEKPL